MRPFTQARQGRERLSACLLSVALFLPFCFSVLFFCHRERHALSPSIHTLLDLVLSLSLAPFGARMVRWWLSSHCAAFSFFRNGLSSSSHLPFTPSLRCVFLLSSCVYGLSTGAHRAVEQSPVWWAADGRLRSALGSLASSASLLHYLCVVGSVIRGVSLIALQNRATLSLSARKVRHQATHATSVALLFLAVSAFS